MIEIVDIMLLKVQERMKDNGISLDFTNAAKQWLADEGFDSIYGARPLRRTIQRTIENPLSTSILRGDFDNTTIVSVGVKDGELNFKSTSDV